MSLREYETIYILKPDLTEDEGGEVNSKLDDVLNREGARILKREPWGKKKLAYEIKKQPKGVYFSLKYLSLPKAVTEFERSMKILEPVLKFQTIKVAEDVDVEKRVAEQEAQDRVAAAAEAKKKAEEEAKRKAFEQEQARREAEIAAASESSGEAESQEAEKLQDKKDDTEEAKED